MTAPSEAALLGGRTDGDELLAMSPTRRRRPQFKRRRRRGRTAAAASSIMVAASSIRGDSRAARKKEAHQAASDRREGCNKPHNCQPRRGPEPGGAQRRKVDSSRGQQKQQDTVRRPALGSRRPELPWSSPCPAPNAVRGRQERQQSARNNQLPARTIALAALFWCLSLATIGSSLSRSTIITSGTISEPVGSETSRSSLLVNKLLMERGNSEASRIKSSSSQQAVITSPPTTITAGASSMNSRGRRSAGAGGSSSSRSSSSGRSSSGRSKSFRTISGFSASLSPAAAAMAASSGPRRTPDKPTADRIKRQLLLAPKGKKLEANGTSSSKAIQSDSMKAEPTASAGRRHDLLATFAPSVSAGAANNNLTTIREELKEKKPHYSQTLRQFKTNRAIEDRAYYTLLAIYTLFIIFGIVSNSLICLTVILKPKILSPRNIFIVNLACSDLLLCAFTMPFSFIQISTKFWMMGELACKLVASLQATSIFVSTISITAIALDRYKVIVYPTHREASGTRNAALLVVSAWIGALFLSLPLFRFRELDHVEPHEKLPIAEINHKVEFCGENWPFAHGRAIFSVFSMMVQYVLPITIVSVVYAKISDKLQKRLMRRQRLTQLECQQKRQLNLIRRTHVMLISVSLIFGLSWLPLNLLNLISDFYDNLLSEELFRVVFATCNLIGCSSACSNPILYGYLNENFRKEFHSVYTHHMHRLVRLVRRICCYCCQSSGDRIYSPPTPSSTTITSPSSSKRGSAASSAAGNTRLRRPDRRGDNDYYDYDDSDSDDYDSDSDDYDSENDGREELDEEQDEDGDGRNLMASIGDDERTGGSAAPATAKGRVEIRTMQPSPLAAASDAGCLVALSPMSSNQSSGEGGSARVAISAAAGEILPPPMGASSAQPSGTCGAANKDDDRQGGDNGASKHSLLNTATTTGEPDNEASKANLQSPSDELLLATGEATAATSLGAQIRRNSSYQALASSGQTLGKTLRLCLCASASLSSAEALTTACAVTEEVKESSAAANRDDGKRIRNGSSGRHQARSRSSRSSLRVEQLALTSAAALGAGGARAAKMGSRVAAAASGEPLCGSRAGQHQQAKLEARSARRQGRNTGIEGQRKQRRHGRLGCDCECHAYQATASRDDGRDNKITDGRSVASIPPPSKQEGVGGRAAQKAPSNRQRRKSSTKIEIGDSQEKSGQWQMQEVREQRLGRRVWLRFLPTRRLHCRELVSDQPDELALPDRQRPRDDPADKSDSKSGQQQQAAINPSPLQNSNNNGSQLVGGGEHRSRGGHCDNCKQEARERRLEHRVDREARAERRRKLKAPSSSARASGDLKGQKSAINSKAPPTTVNQCKSKEGRGAPKRLEDLELACSLMSGGGQSKRPSPAHLGSDRRRSKEQSSSEPVLNASDLDLTKAVLTGAAASTLATTPARAAMIAATTATIATAQGVVSLGADWRQLDSHEQEEAGSQQRSPQSRRRREGRFQSGPGNTIGDRRAIASAYFNASSEETDSNGAVRAENNANVPAASQARDMFAGQVKLSFEPTSPPPASSPTMAATLKGERSATSIVTISDDCDRSSQQRPKRALAEQAACAQIAQTASAGGSGPGGGAPGASDGSCALTGACQQPESGRGEQGEPARQGQQRPWPTGAGDGDEQAICTGGKRAPALYGQTWSPLQLLCQDSNSSSYVCLHSSSHSCSCSLATSPSSSCHLNAACDYEEEDEEHRGGREQEAAPVRLAIRAGARAWPARSSRRTPRGGAAATRPAKGGANGSVNRAGSGGAVGGGPSAYSCTSSSRSATGSGSSSAPCSSSGSRSRSASESASTSSTRSSASRSGISDSNSAHSDNRLAAPTTNAATEMAATRAPHSRTAGQKGLSKAASRGSLSELARPSRSGSSPVSSPLRLPGSLEVARLTSPGGRPSASSIVPASTRREERRNGSQCNGLATTATLPTNRASNGRPPRPTGARTLETGVVCALEMQNSSLSAPAATQPSRATAAAATAAAQLEQAPLEASGGAGQARKAGADTRKKSRASQVVALGVAADAGDPRERRQTKRTPTTASTRSNNQQRRRQLEGAVRPARASLGGCNELA